MLTIGRALMTNPDLLILDEATEGLAPLIAREIWRIVGEIRAHGIATLIVDKNYRARHGDRRPQRDPGQGARRVRGRQRDAARAAGRAAPASRGLAAAECRSSPSRRSASSTERIGIARRDAPTLVFLHEGLGSIAMWRDFPARVARATRLRRDRLFASRLRQVRPAARAADRALHARRGARSCCRELLDRLAIERPILIGHSDGGSIALIHAGARREPPVRPS